MAIKLNQALLKFAEHASFEKNDDAAVQIGEDNELVAATKTAGAVRRWFCLSQYSVKSRRANNEVRQMLLRALSDQFGGFANIPDEVKKVLKLNDFGIKCFDGGRAYTSGKPLTRCRIAEIIDAVSGVLEIMDPVNDATEFAKLDLYKIVQTKLKENVSLTRKPNDLNVTGWRAFEFVKRCFDDMPCKLFSKEAKTIAQRLAGSFNKIVNETKNQIDILLDKSEYELKPNDKIRKKVIQRLMLDSAIEKVGNIFCKSKNEEQCIEEIKSCTAMKLDANDKNSNNIVNNIVNIITMFESNIKNMKICNVQNVPDDIIEAIIECSLSLQFKDAGKSAADFTEMFKEIMQMCGNDTKKAMDLFEGIVRHDIAKPAYVKCGKQLASKISNNKLINRNLSTDESIQAFCEKLKETVNDKNNMRTIIGTNFKTFSTDNVRPLYAAFTMFVINENSEAKEWLTSVGEDDLARFCWVIEGEPMGDGFDAAALAIVNAMQRIKSC